MKCINVYVLYVLYVTWKVNMLPHWKYGVVQDLTHWHSESFPIVVGFFNCARETLA